MSKKRLDECCTITLTYDQADEIMKVVLADAMHNAQKDIRNHPKFAGPEAVAFVKAAKVVLDWWKVPK